MSSEFVLEIRGIKGLQRALRQYPKISHPILQKAFIATEAVFAKHTLKDNPVPWRTGNLLQSFRFKTGELQARWFPTANYAPALEFGTGIYGPNGTPIYPKNASVLSWVPSGGEGKYVTAKTSGRKYYKQGGGGGRVFARYIKGMRPRPFMQAIIDNSKDDVVKLFKEATDMVNLEISKETLND